MCLKSIKTDVFAVDEISTCYYQVNVLTHHLCKHPKYRTEEPENNDIYCYPLEGAPKKPVSLRQLEAHSLKQRNYKPPPDKNEQVVPVYTFDESVDKDGNLKLRVELHTIVADALRDGKDLADLVDSNKRDDGSSGMGKKSYEFPQPPPNIHSIPVSLQDFLMGKNCLRGGLGWWKYKFCYGKSVEQYHIENLPDKIEKTSILLGVFDKKAHLAWINANPRKKPKPLSERTSFSQYYTHGDLCDKTNKERRTEVRLKCVKANSVTLYLLEPRVCNYILGVESALVCELLDMVDDNGLIDYSKDIPPSLADALLQP